MECENKKDSDQSAHPLSDSPLAFTHIQSMDTGISSKSCQKTIKWDVQELDCNGWFQKYRFFHKFAIFLIVVNHLFQEALQAS